MKKYLGKLMLMLILVVLMACERDFDELRDSDQRSVTFTFDLTHFFDHILVYEDEKFVIGASNDLDERQRIRINAYCYDNSGNLVDKTSLFTTSEGNAELKFKHLYKTQEYQFLFLADVVEYYDDNDFYEKWFQLQTYDISKAYVYLYDNFFMKYDDKEVVLHEYLCLKPDNQTVAVEMNAIVKSGFFIFEHVENLNSIAATMSLFRSLFLHPIKGKEKVNLYTQMVSDPDKTNSTSEFMQTRAFYYKGGELETTAPITQFTLTVKDVYIPLTIETRSNSGVVDSITLYIPNYQGKSFVATFDCQTMTLTNCVYY